MKKRFLLPLLAIAAPLNLTLAVVAAGAADAAAHGAACSFGNQDACAVLEARKLESAKNAQVRAQRDAKRDAERKAVAAQKAKDDAWQAQVSKDWEAYKAANPQIMQRDRTSSDVAQCQTALQYQLHDPNSYRQLSSNAEVIKTGVIRYTATNGFGGRVQNTHRCA
jgi:sRNA-binding protein